MKQQKEATCFKARPNTVIFQEPFVPKKEKKSMTGSIICTLGGLGQHCQTFQGECLGLSCVRIMLWQPEAFASRGSSFFSP